MLPILSLRTHIRLITISDLNAIHQLHSQPDVDAYNTLGIPKDLGETEAIISGWIAEHEQEWVSQYTFAIEKPADGAFIGLIALKLGPQKYRSAEVWYKLHPSFWNQGLATEVLKAVLNFGFEELKLHRIQAGCAVENSASIKVLEKVGMQREGRRRAILPLKAGWSDNFEYAILESDERG